MNKDIQITNDVLMAYLDGEATPQETAHIEANRAEFAERLGVLHSADSDLRTRLSKLTPPTPMQLGEYRLGTLSESQNAQIAAWVKRHPVAARELILLDQFLADLEPKTVVESQPGILDQVRVLVGRMLGGGGQPALAMGLRGGTEGIYEAGDFQIVIESDADLEDPSRFALSGLLMGIDDGSAFEAKLWQSETARLLDSAELDEFGNFSFGRLENGTYELIITGNEPAVEIHIQNIEV